MRGKKLKESLRERIKRLFQRKKKKAISADSVRFSYDEREILKDITLNIPEGSLTAIIGKSGCGKSTFLKLAAGIISKKYYGTISILGRAKELRKDKIGFVPQENAFIPDLSILDNIKIIGLNFGLDEKKAIKNAQVLIRLLELDEDLNRKPTLLSGGQKVRLNIILSLLHDPRILILDEPFVGLDFFNRRLLWHFLNSMRSKGKSVILTSHLLSEVEEHVDRLIILKEGKIFFNGKMESLKSKLNMQYIFEVRFTHLSKENYDNINKYCTYRDLKILDRYEKNIMFALNSQSTKETLQKLFSRLDLKYEIISYREPNLDEVFLKT